MGDKNETEDDAITVGENAAQELEDIIDTLRAISARLAPMDGKAALIRREIESALRFA